jgi:hypothetical protein
VNFRVSVAHYTPLALPYGAEVGGRQAGYRRPHTPRHGSGVEHTRVYPLWMCPSAASLTGGHMTVHEGRPEAATAPYMSLGCNATNDISLDHRVL